jgi:hypothetical protein
MRAREGQQRPAQPPEPVPATPGKVTVGGVSYDEANVSAALAAQAAEASRRATLPQRVEDYTPQLPADWKAPAGIEYQLNPRDPAFIAAQQFAHENGLSKDQWSKMLALYASAQVNDLASVTAARNAEIAKLGATASARLTAIEQFFKATYGAADGAIRFSRLLTADDVRIAEREMQRALNPGGSTFTPAREAPHEPGRVSEQEYNRMSHGERMDYARRFSGNGRG